MSHRKLNPVSEVDPEPVDGSDAAKHILAVGDRLEVTRPEDAEPMGTQGTVTHIIEHFRSSQGTTYKAFCIHWDREIFLQQTTRKDEALGRNNPLARLAGWTHWLKVINGPERQHAKENAFSCPHPVTFRESTFHKRCSGVRWGNCIWHFQKGIQVGKNVICYAAQHSGKMYPDHDEIIIGTVATVEGDKVSICWNRHVNCCQQDINTEWIPKGPYSKSQSYDFSDVNLSWTGLKGFSSDGRTAKDVILSAMKNIRCVYNDFPLCVCSDPAAGWEALIAIPSLHSVVITIEFFVAGTLHLRGLSGNSFSIPATVGDKVPLVVEKIREALDLLGQTIRLVTTDGKMLDDDAIVCHEDF